MSSRAATILLATLGLAACRGAVPLRGSGGAGGVDEGTGGAGAGGGGAGGAKADAASGGGDAGAADAPPIATDAPAADARGADLAAGDAPPPIPDTPSCKRRVMASSLAALGTAIGGAMPGDCVVMAAGTYTMTGALPIDRAGTAADRITIMAEAVGGVTLAGTGAFAVNAPAAYVTIRGFRFTHSGGLKVATGTKACLITRNAFEIAGGSSFLTVAGEDNEVSYNSFENKSTTGAFLVLDEDAITLRPYAHHNYLRNHTYAGANGGEALRVFASLPRVEHNLFEEIHVNGEIVSVKEGGGSKGGFYRFNTFRNCTRGTFTLRFARNDVVEGNFFFSTPGIRAYGRDHRIINNYLEGGIIKLGDGAAGAYPAIDNVDVSFNTLVNAHLESEDRGAAGMPPRNLRITNNIIQVDDGTAAPEAHPLVNATFAGNILWGNAAPGGIPAAGYRRVDPQLTGYHLAPGSPAVNAAVGTAIVTDDIEGQPRAMPDVGADELSTSPAPRHPLTPADVGPLGR